MSLKENAKYRQTTGGNLENIETRELSISDSGLKVLSTDLTKLGNTAYFDNISIFNKGTDNVYVSFTGDVDDLDTSDNTTYNTIVYGSTPYTQIELTGRASRVVFKCASTKECDLVVIFW